MSIILLYPGSHRHGLVRLQAGMYIYKKKICTRLVYTTDTVPLGYELVCHNSTFVILLLVYQLSLTQILTVNIILRALKSLNTTYNSIYIHLYANKTFSLSCNFLIQIRFTSNCLKSLKTNHFKHKSIDTFLSIISKIQII